MRCKACDKPLTVAESRWDEEKMKHEDMCTYCLAVALPYQHHKTHDDIIADGESEGLPYEQLELDLGDPSEL